MENQYKLVVNSLKLLALSYKDQKKILPEFVDIIDDVVSEFFNSFHLVPQLMDVKRLSYSAVNKILHCYVAIEMNMSIKERLTDKSFESGESWERVRTLARESLIEMNETVEPPDNIVK